ncbi:MAG: hypothetical protein WCD47_09865 [Candidatus Sulfotelmatobacter sp.]
MNKASTYILAIAVSLGTTAMLNNGHHSKTNTNFSNGNSSSTNLEARMQADGAFRDGFYLGKLAAESGQARRPAVGRWSAERDRVTFTSGYLRGYDEVQAAVMAKRISLNAKSESR